jgi:hypothetical protein
MKKNFGMVLWFLAGWSGGGLLVGLTGLPALLAFMPGIVLAVIVRWDPTGAIWSRSVSGKRIVRPINEFAESLSKNAPSGVVAKDRARF